MKGRDPDLEMFFRYLRFERGSSENTIKAYASDLRAWMLFCRKKAIPYCPPSPELIPEFLAALSRTGRSKSTVQMNAATLRSWMRFLRAEGLIEQTGNLPGFPPGRRNCHRYLPKAKWTDSLKPAKARTPHQ
jgi:integrase/recombinase XerD